MVSTNPAIEPVGRRSNLETEAASKIREAIVEGKLRPGSHLRETDLASSLQISRGTARSALRQLLHEGLVEHRPNHGVFIPAITAADAWEIYTIRNALEGMAAQLAAETITDEGRKRIDAVMEEMEKAAASGQSSYLREVDSLFHRLIVDLSGHRRLQSFYEVVENQTMIFLALTESFHPSVDDVVQFHAPIAEAIVAGDSETAFKLASNHSTPDGKMLVEYFQRHQAEE